jgi:hypothetical protein
MPQRLEELVMPVDLIEANRLLEAYVVFIQRGDTEHAHACKRELDRMKAYKRENEQLKLLKENLKSRGYNEIVVKIENLQIHN